MWLGRGVQAAWRGGLRWPHERQQGLGRTPGSRGCRWRCRRLGCRRGLGSLVAVVPVGRLGELQVVAGPQVARVALDGGVEVFDRHRNVALQVVRVAEIVQDGRIVRMMGQQVFQQGLCLGQMTALTEQAGKGATCGEIARHRGECGAKFRLGLQHLALTEQRLSALDMPRRRRLRGPGHGLSSVRHRAVARKGAAGLQHQGQAQRGADRGRFAHDQILRLWSSIPAPCPGRILFGQSASHRARACAPPA